MLTCERAAIVLRGLEKNQLVVTADEIEELLELGIAVEADPDDLKTLQWLQPTVREFTRCEVGDAQAVPALEAAIAASVAELNNDWYRMTTGKAQRTRREDDVVTMRRAVAYLRDRTLVTVLAKIVACSALLAPDARYVCCHTLGVEHYALTRRGWRARRSLEVRLERFGTTSFKSFLHAFDKASTKMRTFGMEVTTLSRNIGYVKKNREQIVIGLAKTGVPAGNALGAYHAALQAVSAPDVAVTCARNSAKYGSSTNAAHRLRRAEAALHSAGFLRSPLVNGAAKSLLAFDPPEAGLARFIELRNRLEQVFGRGDILFKHTARLMPASGTPAEIVARVLAAGHLLNQLPSPVPGPSLGGQGGAGVALASMVKTPDALPVLVARFREMEKRLADSGLSNYAFVEADALECVGCPGTPIEVVDTVAHLAEELAAGRTTTRADVAVAVAFAKRFPY